jgi:hypothetical protein
MVITPCEQDCRAAPQGRFYDRKSLHLLPLIRGAILLRRGPIRDHRTIPPEPSTVVAGNRREQQAALMLMFLHGHDWFSALITRGYMAALSSQAGGICR